MFPAGKKRRPIWQPSTLQRVRRAFCNIKVSWTGLFAASLVLFLAGVVLPELFRLVVLIDPVSVPKAFEEQGFTGQVVAAEIADKTASIEEAVNTAAAPKGQLRLASDSSAPDIEVPETKLSVRSITQLLQVFLHRQPAH